MNVYLNFTPKTKFLKVNESMVRRIQDLVIFTEEIFNRRLHFLCSVNDVLHNRITDKFHRNAIVMESVFKVKFQDVTLKVDSKKILYRYFLNEAIGIFQKSIFTEYLRINLLTTELKKICIHLS